MSSKRKNTKPTKVYDVQTETTDSRVQNHSFSVQNSPTHISKFCSGHAGIGKDF